MSAFNRAVVLLQILLLVVLLIISAVVPNTVLERLIYTLQQAQDTLVTRWPMSYVFFLVVDVLLIFLLIVLLWLEVRPQAKKTLTVRTISGTQAEVSTASVAQGLQYRLNEISDVFKVRPVVRGKRGGVDVLLDIETSAEIDIPSKVEEVSQAARDLIEHKMGLKVAKIKVQLKQVPHGRAKAAPPAPPAPQAMPPEAALPEQPETEQSAAPDPYSQF
ncbi:MAG: alkaline shock response membrane anchor protein AmaP [Chloroflexi bacterium]|nr:alkaline shock response membrane anchor protein AmaP [Chloroflexota bacterium]